MHIKRIFVAFGLVSLLLAASGCFSVLSRIGGSPSTSGAIVAGTLDVVTAPIQLPFWIVLAADQGIGCANRAMSEAAFARDRKKALNEVRANPALLETSPIEYRCEGTRYGLAYADPTVTFSERALVTHALQYQSRSRSYCISPSNTADMVALMRRSEWTPAALEALAPQIYQSSPNAVYAAYLNHPQLPRRVYDAFMRQPNFRFREDPVHRKWALKDLPPHPFAGVEGVGVDADTNAVSVVLRAFGDVGDRSAVWRIGGMWNSCAIGALKAPEAFDGPDYRGRVVEIYTEAPNSKGTIPAERRIDPDARPTGRTGAIVCEFDTTHDCLAFLRALVPLCRYVDPMYWDQLFCRPSLDEDGCFAICTEKRKMASDESCRILIVDLTEPSSYRFWPPNEYHSEHVWYCDTQKVK